MSTPSVALTIAGSDSGGGAGLQADLKCFAALRVHGTCAATAVTAQNTVGVRRIHVIPPQVVDDQIAAVIEDLAPSATKTGMLAGMATMEVVAARAAAGSLPRLVVDPVMVSSSGDRLLDADAQQAYLQLLFPLATVVTPNLLEASGLLGWALTSVEDMAEAARRLHDSGAQVVVVKGGHLPGAEACDVVFDGLGITVLSSPRIATANLHGTGCTFSAAVTAHLAAGLLPVDAVVAAKDFVDAAIRGAAEWSLGAGPGPLDHFGWSDPRPSGARPGAWAAHGRGPLPAPGTGRRSAGAPRSGGAGKP